MNCISLLRTLWVDEDGFVTTSDLILISAILVIGMLVGLVTVRDQVVQEFGDIATAIGQLNQSYSFGSVTIGGFTVAGSSFADLSDDCEAGTAEGSANNDSAGDPPGCINICGVAASAES